MEFQNILTLIDKVAGKESLSCVEIEEDGFRILIRRGNEENPAAAEVPASPKSQKIKDSVSVSVLDDRAGEEKKESGPVAESAAEDLVVSPLVGTFYAAPAEDADPFVKVGDRVKKGQILGIVEAMKLMNEIESDYEGTVEAVLVNNGQMVEYGQPMFRIREDK